MYFYLSSPLVQSWLITKKQKEYHIKLYNNKDKSQFYFNNTKKDLWNELYKYIKIKWDISNIGLDYDWKESNYLWLHVENNETTINEILTDLNDNYSKELQSYLFPKLLCTITKKLSSDEQYFAKSICEHQDKYGKEQTEFVLHVYFNDIKPSQLYLNRKYHTDSDGD